MPAPSASILLERLNPPAGWRATKAALCRWQAEGRAHLEILRCPVDIVSIARAASVDDLPRPAGCPASEPYVVVVFDPRLAHGLIRLAAHLADRDGPPPDAPPPIGSQP